MSREVVKVFTDVTESKLGPVLQRIKRWSAQMDSHAVEVTEQPGYFRKTPKMFYKIIWRYTLKNA